MSMTRRRFLRSAATALGSLLAAACDLPPPSTTPEETSGAATPAPPRPQEQAPTKANPPRTVQVLVASPEWLKEHSSVLEPLAEDFTSRHPHLSVDWQPLPLTHDLDSPGFGQQIGQLHSAGLLFDVMQLSLDLTSHLFIGDAAVDLHPFVRSDKYVLSDYWPGAIAAMQWRQQLYGLHTEVRPTVIHCNEGLFAQAGLDVPTTTWTWPQLLAAAKQLTDRRQPQPIFGFALDVQTLFFTLPWIWANGGAMLSADRSESLVAQPAAQEALQWLRDLALIHEVTPREADLRKVGFGDLSALDVVGPFVDGRVAMLYAYWVSERTVTQAPPGNSPQFGLAMVEPPRSASFLDQGLGAYHLSKSARVPGDAWRFLSWWTSAETQRRFQAESDGFMAPPARRSLAGEFGDRYGAATLAALAYARPLPLHPKWYDLVRAYDRGLLPVWKGEQSVAEATAAIASEQNAILAAWRRKQQGTP
ncbi:MAG: extracellular solute-binding protein [Chloroflexota bacterium]|nr:extracellular solute-binding protein [Chloroflexota bacterium]